MSSKQVFIASILESVTELFIKRNKGYDEKIAKEYFAHCLRSIPGRKKIINLLRSYKNKSTLVVDKSLIQNVIDLIYLVYGEF